MKSGYKVLPWMLLAHFVVMYAVMYVMVDKTEDIFLNINRGYMAGMMIAPMLPMMLLWMGSMYPNRKLNVVLSIAALAVFAALFAATRRQALIGNGQFLRAMIPHHSGAIVMCERSSISDPEIVNLCGQIVKAQKEEIAQMKEILQRLDR